MNSTTQEYDARKRGHAIQALKSLGRETSDKSVDDYMKNEMPQHKNKEEWDNYWTNYFTQLNRLQAVSGQSTGGQIIPPPPKAVSLQSK
jgi:hypothetical protein